MLMEEVIALSVVARHDLACIEPEITSEAVDVLVRTVCDHLCASSSPAQSKVSEAVKALGGNLQIPFLLN